MRWRKLEPNGGAGVTPVTTVSVIGNTRASAYEGSGDPRDGCDTPVSTGLPHPSAEVLNLFPADRRLGGHLNGRRGVKGRTAPARSPAEHRFGGRPGGKGDASRDRERGTQRSGRTAVSIVGLRPGTGAVTSGVADPLKSRQWGVLGTVSVTVRFKSCSDTGDLQAARLPSGAEGGTR